MVLDLQAGDAHSLKEKRQLVRSVKERLRRRFNVAVIESGFQDSWQRAQVSLVTVAMDRRILDGVLSRVENFVADTFPMFSISVEREYL